MRVVLTFVLMLAAAPAWAAEWLKVNEDARTVFYIRPDSITKSGEFRSAWELHDSRAPNRAGDRSRQFLNEYDCKTMRVRTLSFSAYSGPMLSGKIVGDFIKPTKWQFIPSDTPVEFMLKLVCSAP